MTLEEELYVAWHTSVYPYAKDIQRLASSTSSTDPTDPTDPTITVAIDWFNRWQATVKSSNTSHLNRAVSERWDPIFKRRIVEALTSPINYIRIRADLLSKE